mgnify:CR=1 FL=1
MRTAWRDHYNEHGRMRCGLQGSSTVVLVQLMTEDPRLFCKSASCFSYSLASSRRKDTSGIALGTCVSPLSPADRHCPAE